jgi:serine/threonine protein kinase
MQSPGTQTSRMLGRYELLRPLGSGGAGTVYEAADRTLGRRVALKLLHTPRTEGALGDLAAARFLREGRASARIRHPHVVAVYDVGVDDLGHPFLVMELVEGETLAQLLRYKGKLPVAHSVEILLPLLSAVADLHTAGIVHRDIKPANVLLARGRDVSPKLADFGVSRIDDDSPSLTRSGAVLGTPDYMAPELLSTTHAPSELSDQYALGLLLYECLVGQKPFRGSRIYDLMHAIVRGKADPPSVCDSGLPTALDAVVLRAMHREPSKRFGCIEEFAVALLPFASVSVAARWRSEFDSAGEDAEIEACAPMAHTLAPETRRKQRAALVVGACALAVPMAVTVIVRTAHLRAAEAELAMPPARLSPNEPSKLDSDPPLQVESRVPDTQISAPVEVPDDSPVARHLSVSVSPVRPAASSAPHLSTRTDAGLPAMGENGAPILDVP